MTRVNSTCTRGASAIGVPGCPEFAFCTASIASARTTLTARSSIPAPDPLPASLDTTAAPSLRSRQPTRRLGSVSGEDREARGVPVQEVAPTDRTDLARAERTREWGPAELLLDECGVVIGMAEEAGPATVAGEEQRRGTLDRFQQQPQ